MWRSPGGVWVGQSPKISAGLSISVIVLQGGADVNALLLPALERFLKNDTLASKFLLEQGGTAALSNGGAHLDTVYHSSEHAGEIVLGMGCDPTMSAVVMCQTLKKKGLHKFLRMLGYCKKDGKLLTFNRWTIVSPSMTSQQVWSCMPSMAQMTSTIE